jgi:hypothetical protein
MDRYYREMLRMSHEEYAELKREFDRAWDKHIVKPRLAEREAWRREHRDEWMPRRRPAGVDAANVLAFPHARRRDNIILRDVPIFRAGIKLQCFGWGWSRVLRPPSEVIRAAQTFDGAPILLDHNEDMRLVLGYVECARWRDAGFEMVADLSLYGIAADAVVRGVWPRQLSVKFDRGGEYDWTPGLFCGEPYDGSLSGLKGQHLALVAKGWAGPRYALPI